MSREKNKGRKWDGKSRVSNDLYRERWDEIFKKRVTEGKDPFFKNRHPDESDPNWAKGYNKWKKKNEEE
jgi:hypothetical protein|tara:strand:- start:78 stop:284 length:207 start_codon:yes stop_codon:yes gene_type:complete